MNESGKIAFRSYHDWILPKKILLGILIFSCVFLFIGVIMLAISGSIGLSAVGTVLAGLGGCGFMILFLLCLHAYFVIHENDESTQTWENVTSDITIDPSEFPAYATVQKPSALKDGSLKKNGKLVTKKVTLPPDIGIENGNKSPAINTVAPSIQQQHFPEQYEYPTYTDLHRYPSQGQEHSPQFPIYSQQSPQTHSLPQGYGQQYPNQCPQQDYPVTKTQTPYPLQHPPQTHTSYPPQHLPQTQTPYSPQHTPHTSIGYDDDYDNIVESTPMMVTRPINAKHLCYKPDTDLPEPQPLQYPSAKRPMVFEQTSSSKMSVYDNVVLFSGKEA